MEEWFKKVEKVESAVKKLMILFERVNRSHGCFSKVNHSPCLRSRYNLSKEAVKQTGVVCDLQQGGNFNTISRSPLLSIDQTPIGHSEAFESTKSATKQISDALGHDEIDFVRVYGMG